MLTLTVFTTWHRALKLKAKDVWWEWGELVWMDVCGLNPVWVCVAWAEGDVSWRAGLLWLKASVISWGWGEDAGRAVPFNCTPKFASQLRKNAEI